jgi:hypothetical protein
VSTDPGAPGASEAGPGQAPGEPSEEELRAAYEAELSRITSADMMLQAAVSLLNIGSYRLGLRPPAPAGGQDRPSQSPPEGRDLDQVRDAIDGVRALMEILERRIPNELRPLRDALSQLQMAYAREVAASGGAPAAEAGGPAEGGPKTPSAAPATGQAGKGERPQGEDPGGPGPAESSGRLWVPGR